MRDGNQDLEQEVAEATEGSDRRKSGTESRSGAALSPADRFWPAGKLYPPGKKVLPGEAGKDLLE
jgi:hypothetical protein